MRAKAVVQYNLRNQKIDEFDCPKDACEALGRGWSSGNSISNACKSGNYCYGYLWKYKEDIKKVKAKKPYIDKFFTCALTDLSAGKKCKEQCQGCKDLTIPVVSNNEV